jgi:hypothetical protein
MTDINSLKKRFALFLFGCIGIRILFVYIAKKSTKTQLRQLGYLAMLLAIGLMYIYLSGSRQTGVEVFGEKIWWNNLRPIHALLYTLFAYNAILQRDYAWKFLFADVWIGLMGFSYFHYSRGNFTKVICSTV